MQRDSRVCDPRISLSTRHLPVHSLSPCTLSLPLCTLSLWTSPSSSLFLSPFSFSLLIFSLSIAFSLTCLCVGYLNFRDQGFQSVFRRFRKVFSLSFWIFLLHQVDLYLYYVFVSVFSFCTGMYSCICKRSRARYCICIYL